MRMPVLIAATTLLAACSSEGPDEPLANEGEAPGKAANAVAAAGSGEKISGLGWDLQSSGEGASLVFAGQDRPAIRLFCPSGGKRLVVNVPGFQPVGSEERLSFGSGSEVVALVADTRGDRQRGGVTGTAALPANLEILIGGSVSASYGAQSSGPHPAIPAGLSSAFVAACREGSPPGRRPRT